MIKINIKYATGIYLLYNVCIEKVWWIPDFFCEKKLKILLHFSIETYKLGNIIIYTLKRIKNERS